MTEEKITENKIYYDNRFGTLSQKLNEEEQIRWEAISTALNELQIGKKIKIADFGCGRGWLSKKLSQFGSVTGFDLSEKAIENAKHSFPELEFVCLNAAASISEQFIGQFDLVVSSEVIEHIEEQQQYLLNLAQLLKKGGHFLISTPNGKWKENFYCNGREKWKQPVENWLSAFSLEEILKKAELKVIRASSFNSEWIFQFLPSISIAWIAQPLIRKTLKAFGIYKMILNILNKQKYGLNLIIFGKK